MKLLVWTLLAVVVTPIILILGTSQQFQTCMGEAANYLNYKTFKFCLVDYITAKNSLLTVLATLVTALAALATAYFTATIWSINRNQLRHARQVERAYISGGGGYLSYVSDDGTHVDTTQFVLTVQNYGKTPATVTAYAVFVVDRAKLPLEPAYLNPGFAPTRFNGVYQFGSPTSPITQTAVPPGPNPIAYGRLWYTDIYGGRHLFSFALPIRNPADHSSLADISRAYTEST
jgi:hypothetical protein